MLIRAVLEALFGSAVERWGEAAVATVIGALIVLLFVGLGIYFGDARVVAIFGATGALIAVAVFRDRLGIRRIYVWIAALVLILLLFSLLPRSQE